jgi:hypothetical protein
MEQNKTAKYIKYAIGEIVLVVIGILIALSINNWNEARKENIRAIEYLSNIKEDLAADTLMCNIVLPKIERTIENAKLVLRQKDFSNMSADSLYNSLPYFYFEYKINTETYNKILNAGLTELLTHKELFNEITTYYTAGLELFNAKSVYDINHTVREVILLESLNLERPIYMQNHSLLKEEFNYIQSDQERKSNLIAFVTSVKGRNYLRDNLTRKIMIYDAFFGVKENAKKLIQKIDNNLKEINDKIL